jgi:hypothetical protein
MSIGLGIKVMKRKLTTEGTEKEKSTQRKKREHREEMMG